MKAVKSVLFVGVLILIVTGFLLAETPSGGKPQTIYALLVIADADPSIGVAVEVDKRRIEDMLKVAGGICNVEADALLSSRNELKGSLIMQWLEGLRPNTDDTVFVYYSGHGGMDKNKETFLYLQDGIFWRSKLASALENFRKCRLRILITDCCSNAPEPPEVTTPRPVTSKKVLNDLFLEHEGFLHITAASEGEYSWCSPKFGGWFTRALINSLDDSSDTDRDGFISWKEVFELTREETQKRFNQASPYFSDAQKKDMQSRGITGQNPKAYSLPRRHKRVIEEIKIAQVTPEERQTVPESDGLLWNMRNPSPSFSLSVETDKSEYTAGSPLFLRVQASADCYIILLSWDAKGEPVQIFPNSYESGNFVVRGKEYVLPSSSSRFDFRVSGSKGEGRLKAIAIRNRADSLRIRNLMPVDSGGSSLSRIAVVPKGSLSGKDVEAKIIEAIQRLRRADWAEASCTIRIQ